MTIQKFEDKNSQFFYELKFTIDFQHHFLKFAII